MVCYKRLFLILLLICSFLFVFNNGVFAYSFVDKDGEVYETSGDPMYSSSSQALVTYYDGYYYFFAPNDPSGSANCFWYVNNNGDLWNSYKYLDGNYSIYSARIIDGGHASWESLGFISSPSSSDNLFYENITYNNSDIYDSENGLMIIKPSMSLDGLTGMEKGVNDLLLSLTINDFWGVFINLIPFVALVVLFVLGLFFVRSLLVKPSNNAYNSSPPKYDGDYYEEEFTPDELDYYEHWDNERARGKDLDEIDDFNTWKSKRDDE